MMDKSLRQRMWPVFAEEANERLGVVIQGILELGRDPSQRSPGVLDAVRRELHSIKGAGQSVGVDDVGELAHSLEDALAPLEPSERIGAALLQAALAATSAMSTAIEEVSALGEGTIPALAQLVAGLSRSGGIATAAEAAGVTPTSPMPFPQRASDESSPAAAALTGGTLRVSVSALDRLSERVESFAVGQSKSHRHLRLLSAWEEQTENLIRSARHLSSTLVGAGEGEPAERLNELRLHLRQLHEEIAREASGCRSEAEQELLNLSVVREDLRDLRLVPASTLLDPLSRAVGELCVKLGKEAQLRLEGMDVRLDRGLITELRGPLLHLLRNALDHGLEPPADRLASGKPAQGTLWVRVEWRGPRVLMTVSDDGRGLSLERVKEEAVRRGLVSSESAASLSEREVQALAFHPGLSTAKAVTDTSGRGIGLNVVRDVVVRLGGEVRVSSEAGLGTSFELDLPLSLAATLGVRVRVGEERLIIPLDAVERVIRIAPTKLGTLAGRPVAHLEDGQLPFGTLREVLHLKPRDQGRAEDWDLEQPALVLDVAGRRAVLGVDEIEGQFEVVLQPLAGMIGEAQHLAGAAVLDDGSVVGVANAAALLEVMGSEEARPQAEREGPQVLVVDDSITTRMTIKALLEMAGYSVVTANNGDDGLRVLSRSQCPLVVTDVEMPGLTGIELTRRIKATPGLSRTKVLVVTSLDSESDRAAGLEAGADGYLVKSGLERGALIDLVQKLLPARVREG